MNTNSQRAAKLAQIDNALAMDKRHRTTMTALVLQCRARGWSADEARAQELLDKSNERLSRLDLQGAELVLTMSQADEL